MRLISYIRHNIRHTQCRPHCLIVNRCGLEMEGSNIFQSLDSNLTIIHQLLRLWISFIWIVIRIKVGSSGGAPFTTCCIQNLHRLSRQLCWENLFLFRKQLAGSYSWTIIVRECGSTMNYGFFQSYQHNMCNQIEITFLFLITQSVLNLQSRRRIQWHLLQWCLLHLDKPYGRGHIGIDFSWNPFHARVCYGIIIATVLPRNL